MYKDDYGRHWHGPYAFTPVGIAKDAIDRFGVYQVLYSGESGLVVAYIGIATGDTTRGRLTKHLKGASNSALGRLINPSKFSFVFECDAGGAHQIESHVIITKKPPFDTRPEYKDFVASISVH
jgi:hypothetical protein